MPQYNFYLKFYNVSINTDLEFRKFEAEAIAEAEKAEEKRFRRQNRDQISTGKIQN